MMPIQASRTNAYTGSPLDRVSERRGDAEWVAARLADPASLVAPMWRGRCLVRAGEAGPRALLLQGEDARACRELGAAAEASWALLGLQDGVAVFAVEMAPPGAAERAPEDDPLAGPLAGMSGLAGASLEELRRVAGSLPAAEASILAHARGLMHWRSRHRFCGACGGACAAQSAGNVLACTRCGTHHFPRTDPAVIMLVTTGDRALLGHSQRFPRATMYSTLAGFVEPGESLEEAVRREVMEESGIRVGAVHYHSSQPWPFPASIMLGFYGEALSEDIVIDPNELRDARWFTRAEMRDHDAHGFQLPNSDSIARRLVDDWIAAA